MLCGVDICSSYCFIDNETYNIGLLNKSDLSCHIIGKPFLKDRHNNPIYIYAEYENNRVFFIPWQFGKIIVFDIESNAIKCIDLLSKVKKSDIDQLNITNYIFYKGKLYLFISEKEIRVYVVDTSNYVITEKAKLSEVIGDYLNEAKSYHGKGMVFYEDILFYSPGYGNAILKIDLTNEIITTIELDRREELSKLLMIIDEELWFVYRGNGGIGKYNIKTNMIRIYDKYPEGFCVGVNDKGVPSQPFLKAMMNKQYIVLVPSRVNQVLVFDRNKEEFISICSIELTNNIQYRDYYVNENTITFFPYQKDDFIRVNIETLICEKSNSMECYAEILKKELLFNSYENILEESGKIGLEDLLSYLGAKQ